MGLLDKWTSRKKKEQLESVAGQASASVSAESIEVSEAVEVEEEKKAVKKITKKEKDSAKEVKVVKKLNLKDSSVLSVLLKPLVSEKTARLENLGIYTFLVDTKVNKFRVKEAIKQIYGVLPRKVRIVNGQGKWVRFGQRYGRRNDWKKAVITLPKGKTIDIHEGV